MERCPHCGAPASPEDFQCPRCELLLNVEGAPPHLGDEEMVPETSVVRALLAPPERRPTGEIPVPPPRAQIPDRPTARYSVPMDEQTVPRVRGGVELASKLHAFEAYLVSYVDGASDVASVARSCRISVLEAQIVLTSLLERNVVDLHRGPALGSVEPPPTTPAIAPNLAAWYEDLVLRERSLPAASESEDSALRESSEALAFDDVSQEDLPGPMEPGPDAGAPSGSRPAMRVPEPITPDDDTEPTSPGLGASPTGAEGVTPLGAERNVRGSAAARRETEPEVPNARGSLGAAPASPNTHPNQTPRPVRNVTPPPPRSGPWPPMAPLERVKGKGPSKALREATLARNSGSANVIERAVALERRGDLAGAIEVLRRAIAGVHHPAPLYNKLALILVAQRKDFRQAEELLRKAVQLEPLNSIYQQNLYKVVGRAAMDAPKPSRGGFLSLLRRKS